MLKMIRFRSKDNRVWSLIKRIREVRRLYWGLIKKSNNINQSLIQQGKVDKAKKRATSLALNAPATNADTKDSK